MSTFLPIKSHCIFPSHTHFKNPPIRTSPAPSLLPQTSFSRFSDGPRYRYCVLAKAEDKARENEELTTSSGTCDPLCSVDETSSQEFEATYQPKTDLLKAFAVLAAAVTGTVAINQSWVAANQDIAMALLFGLGYMGIIFEESLAFNKSGVGLLMAVSLWTIRSIGVRLSSLFETTDDL
ncbi:hypothetical protein A4A49_06305 [Nicotiana attenuata]|uniref:Uncharacterized protein n=1 Tax=Nicotiana attenuata TaxID=49451 RepID=A0A1J6JDX1_NICAT|nr:hypothetical protein A4A49_06305 [Nicotiana attenuata]